MEKNAAVKKKTCAERRETSARRKAVSVEKPKKGRRMRRVKVVTLDLVWEKEVPLKTGIPHLLRGAISAMYPAESLLHQHRGEEAVYRYPRVQFRWEGGRGKLVGFQEGAELLGRLPLLGKALPLGEFTRQVKEIHARYEEVEIQESEPMQEYRLKTPWLALNQERFREYQELPLDGKIKELERLAVGSILMAMKGLEIEVTWRLQAKLKDIREIPSTFKGMSFLGVQGILCANIRLPEHLGIGKASSHGYGWLVSAGEAGEREEKEAELT